MNLSPAELTRILNQSGYTLADGSLLDTPRPPFDVVPPHPGKASRWFSERHFQEEVIAQCDIRAVLEPEYGLVFAIPNGQYRSGQRVEPGLRMAGNFVEVVWDDLSRVMDLFEWYLGLEKD